MNKTEYYTPQKLNSTSFRNNFNNIVNSTTNNLSPIFQSSSTSSIEVGISALPALTAATSSSSTTSISSSKKTTGSFHLLPFFNTPPTTRLKKVINPFESGLTADCLNLPVVFSPSIFKPPSTPKNKSISQFEWTIDDVSSLKPANVEPHETQFIESSPDPEFEKKAQTAILTYFKEQLITPSPVIECSSIRNKVLLKNCNENNDSKSNIIASSSSSLKKSSVSVEIISKIGSKKKSRNMYTQTMLSFPSELPIEIERILEKYCTINDKDYNKSDEDQNDSNCSKNSNNYESREVSRKLFDNSINNIDDFDIIKTPEKSNFITCNNLSPSLLGTPELDIKPLNVKNSGSINDTSFGTISPISKLGSPIQLISPQPQQQHRENICSSSYKVSIVNLSSPINENNKNEKNQVKKGNLHQRDQHQHLALCRTISNQSIYKSVDDTTIPVMNISIDNSFINDDNDIKENTLYQQYNRDQQPKLQIQYQQQLRYQLNKQKYTNNGKIENIIENIENNHEHNNDRDYDNDDDNEMQISLLSGKSLCISMNSFNNSDIGRSGNDGLIESSQSSTSSSLTQSQHPDTPIKKRYPSRKNLSHSFTFHNLLNNDDDDDKDDNEFYPHCYDQIDYNNDDERNNKENENVINIKVSSSLSSLIVAKKFHMQIVDKISSTSPLPLKYVTPSSPVSSVKTNNYNANIDRSLLYATDSGFNEMTSSTQDETKFTQDLNIRCGLNDNYDTNGQYQRHQYHHYSNDYHKKNINLLNDISMIDVTTINEDGHNELLPSVSPVSSPMRCCSTPSSKIK